VKHHRKNASRVQRRRFSRALASLRGILLAALLAAGDLSATAQDTVYVFAYFQGGWPTGGSSGVFLDYSQDGLRFSPLNDGNAVMTPPQPPDFPDGENQTRDPSLTYGPDGLFHMVWTSGIDTRTIGHATSPDLVTWSAPQRIQVWDDALQVGHTWAPEIYYDDGAKTYHVFWASNVSSRTHRQFSFTTADFATFSPVLPSQRRAPFFDPEYDVIDAMIAYDEVGREYVMAFKDERRSGKNIKLTRRASLESGAWGPPSEPIVGPGSGVRPHEQAEGPSLLKIGDTWHLYYDSYGARHMSLATSPDLVKWADRTGDAKLPSGHHGTVIAAPREKVGWLGAPQAAEASR